MKNKDNIAKYSVLVFIGTLFLLDILNKFEFIQNKEGIGFFIIKIIKLFFELVFLFFLAIQWQKTKRFFYLLGGVLLSFFIGQLTLYFNSDLNQFAEYEMYRYVSLYFFPLIFIEFSSKYWNKNKSNNQWFIYAEQVLLGVFLINTICIITGVLFGVEFFKTYDKNRWGYMGLMPRSITASYFYIGVIFYLYSKRLVSLNYKLLFQLAVVSSVLIGTKSIYLYLALLFSYHIIVNQYYKNKIFYILTILSILGTIVFYDFIFEQIINRFFKGLYNLYEQKGWLTAVMSFRDEIFRENTAFYSENWNGLNFIFGGRIFNWALFENSLFDLLIFFGLLGAILYLSYFYKKLLRNRTLFIKINLVFVFIISIFAGQFFSNISAMTYFISFVLLVKKDFEE